MYVEITHYTAALWCMKGIIALDCIGDENVYYFNEFGMRFSTPLTGYVHLQHSPPRTDIREHGREAAEMPLEWYQLSQARPTRAFATCSKSKLTPT